MNWYLFNLVLFSLSLGLLAQTCKDIKLKNERVCFVGKTVTRLQSESIKSEYFSPTSLNLTVTGILAGLRIDFTTQKLIGFKPPIVPGFIDVKINQTNMGLELDLVAGGINNEIPVALTFPSCYLYPLHIYEAGTTSPPAKANITSKELIAILEEELPIIFCENITGAIAHNVTLALQNNIDPKLTEIIESQPTIVPYMGSDYIDWNDSLIGLIHKIVSSIGNGKIWDCLSAAIPSLNGLSRPLINLLIDRATNGTGSLTVDLLANGSYPSASFAGKEFILETLVLSGLDTFDSVSLFSPSPNNSLVLSSSVSLHTLKIALGLVEVNGTGSEQSLDIVFNVSNINVEFDLAAALNKTKLEHYYLGQINNMDCFVQLFDYFLISSLTSNIDVSQIAIQSVSGSATDEIGMTALVNNLFALLTQGYSEMITDLIAGIFQGPVRDGLNEKITEKWSEIRMNGTCPEPPVVDSSTPPEYKDWSNSTVVTFVDLIVNQALGAQGVNNLVNCFTDNTGSFSLDIPGTQLALSLSGLNSFSNLQLLATDPSSPYQLNNGIGINSLKIVLSSLTPLEMWKLSSSVLPSSLLDNIPSSLLLKPLLSSLDNLASDAISTLAMNARSQLSTASPADYSSSLLVALPTLPAGWTVSVDLTQFSLNLDLLAMMDTNQLQVLSVDQLGVKGCVGSAFNSIAVTTETATLQNASIVLHQGSKVVSIENAVSKILDALTSQKQIDKRNANIAYELSVAAETCENGGIPPNPVTPSSNGAAHLSSAWTWQISILAIGCICALLIFASAYYQYNKKGNEDMLEYYNLEETFLGRIYESYQLHTALVFQSNIPFWVRILFPFAVLANIGLFLYSNLSPDAVTVEAHLTLGTRTISPSHPIFAFGLSNTVHDMWNAKVYPLAILIAFFSGAWPYIKLAVMFISWMFPISMLSIARRESYLVFVDMFGKWSLIDFFVMMMMMCAFYFNLGLAGNEIVIEVFVVPNLGFYTFLLATMMSLGLGHICIACHRAIVEEEIEDLSGNAAPRESLVDHQFKVEGDLAHHLSSHYLKNQPLLLLNNNNNTHSDSTQHNNNNHNDQNNNHHHLVTVQVTRNGKIFLVLLILLTLVMTVISTIIDTFNFDFKGLTGWLLKSSADVSYGFTTVGTAVPIASGKPNDFGVRWMEASYFAFGIGMPLGLLVVVLYLLFSPLPVARLKQFFVVMEVLNAWTALDVFVVSILAALLEVQQFAAFIVGDACDGINVIIAEYFNNQVQGDDKCFDVVATLKTSCWTIFLASILLAFVGIVGHSVVRNAIEDRVSLTQARRAQIIEYNLEIARENGLKSTAIATSTLKNPLIERDDSSANSKEPNKKSSRNTVTATSSSSSPDYHYPDEKTLSSTDPNEDMTSSSSPRSNLSSLSGLFVRTLCWSGLVRVFPSTPDSDPYSRIFSSLSGSNSPNL